MTDPFLSVAARVLGVDAGTLSDASSPETVPSWDSMNGLLLVSELESAFSVTFTMEETLSVKTLGDFRGIVRAKGKDV